MAQSRWFSLLLALLVAGGIAARGQSATGAGPCSNGASSGDLTPAAAVSRLAGDWRASAPQVVAASRPAVPRDGTALGFAAAGTRLDRMLLLLEAGAARRQALDAELEAQQTPGSCAFHQWLSPQQFADRFGNSPSDVSEVAEWLRSEGFAVAEIPAGRGWIEFSGTAGQVEQAFQVRVRAYATASGTRYVLGGDISVPAALAPVIQGLVSLDGSRASAAITTPKAVGLSASDMGAAADAGGTAGLTPQMAAKTLNLPGALSVGEGESIAIAARSNIQAQDVAEFRSTFGLPANPVVVVPAGDDPGLTSDQAATELSASWAGVAAPGARIIVAPAAGTAATEGIDLSVAAIVDRALAHTVLIGYSDCEAALSEAHQGFYAALYRQAAAQGMAVIAAAGDSGAAACHAAGSDAAVTSGYAVNGLGATPWNTAVGAAAFASGSSDLSAWSPAHDGEPAYAGGGGSSTTYALPGWQKAVSQGAAGRQLPDVALPTAVDAVYSRGLAFCFSDSMSSGGCTLMRSGGSGAAAALFAGISAGLAQQYGAQGNLAPRLYALRSRAGLFRDIEQGSTRMACAAGSPGCDGSGQIGYDAKAGYDLATGLGSPNAQKLIDAWMSPNPEGTGANTVTLTASPVQPNATYNPSATITLTAAVTSGTGGAVPTGTVNFFNQATGKNLNPSPVSIDGTGKATVTVTGGLPQGGNTIIAQYSGDGTYSATNSPALTLNMQPSTTTTTVNPSTTTPATGTPFAVTVSVAAGSPAAGTAAPTGNVQLTLDGQPYGTAAVSTANGTTSATFQVTIKSGGSHNLQAMYAGDTNYSASTSASVTVTASKGATVTTLTATPTTLTAGTPETLTATIAPVNPGTGTAAFTGTVTFFDGTTQLGTATVSGNTATLANVNLSTSTTHIITAVYSGDDSWGGSTSNALTMKAVLLPVTITLTATPAVAGPGQVVTLTATVTPSTAPASTAQQNPTGSVVFYNGTKILATVPLTAGPNNTAVAQLQFATLPAGQNTITAAYLGDLVYAAATSNAVAITVQDFTLTPAPTNPPADLDIVKGTSGQASFIVNGLGGFNSPISVVCSVPATDYMTCTANPQQVTPTATVTFTVNTFLTGTQAALRHEDERLWPRAVSGTALAGLLFFLLPFGRRARIFSDRGRRLMVLMLLLCGVGFAGIGCSSLSNRLPATGTPLGQTTLTITAATSIDNTVVSHSVYLNVNVLPQGATGTAQPVIGPK